MPELVKLKLSKEWNAHAAGSTVVVDPLRAEWLAENGYTEEKKKRGRVSKSSSD